MTLKRGPNWLKRGPNWLKRGRNHMKISRNEVVLRRNLFSGKRLPLRHTSDINKPCGGKDLRRIPSRGPISIRHNAFAEDGLQRSPISEQISRSITNYHNASIEPLREPPLPQHEVI